jgi:hypothetical protein
LPGRRRATTTPAGDSGEPVPGQRALRPGWRARLDAGGHPRHPSTDPVLEAQVTADKLNADADEALAEARYDNQISDNFVLTAVLFASVLFFAGTAAKFRPQWIRWAMIAVAVVVFGIGLVVEFTLPQSIGF